MKFKDALNFFTRMVFIIMSVRFFFVLIFTKLITFLVQPNDVSCDNSYQCVFSACDTYDP